MLYLEAGHKPRNHLPVCHNIRDLTTYPNQDLNRLPPPFVGLQRRDDIIYTLGIGSVVYYFHQNIIVLLSHLKPLSCLTLLSIEHTTEQVPETCRWRFMDVSPKFEASVRALLVPVVHTLSLLTSISAGRFSMTNSPGVPWRASPTFTRYNTSRSPCCLANP